MHWSTTCNIMRKIAALLTLCLHFDPAAPAAFVPSANVHSTKNVLGSPRSVGAPVSTLPSATALFASTIEKPLVAGGIKSLEDYVKERGGERVIRKVLIANNGMAATKSIISMRQWAYMELEERATSLSPWLSEDLKR
jgi:acetyl-CoA carboxylase/biotin carboxylase 1